MDPDGVCARAGDLPREPGVYQFEDEEGRVLYVGKAVDLRDRVRSYADPRSNRIAKMVERAAVVDFAVTDTETQALLLEANLIKRHRPPYNVRLKDDKSYPLVQLTDHAVPRIEVTRDPDDGATVYGPFTDKGRVETVVKALRETYGLRGCSDHKYSTRDRPCLDYEMGICTAPCTGEITETDYAADVESVERFFEGEIGVLADPLRQEMEAAAQEQEFERAANLRDKLGAVEALHGEGDAAVSDVGGAAATDVLGAVVEGDRAVVARLHAEGGKLVERERHTLDAPDGEGPEGVYRAFITQYYAEREFPGTILCAEDPADAEIERWLEREGVDLRVPGAGREATLVDLALKNARQRGGADDEVGALADALGIDRPERIEGFDVSHAQGTSVVGSNVTVVGGSAETSDYRRKKLTERNDDYANMRELVRWRAERAVSDRDDRPDPDLLLIDGGDGQLGAARDALAETGWDVPAVALAKDEELVITPDRGPASAASGTSSQAERSYGVYDWPDDAPHLHLLQRVRDEAHRFAVQYHQTLRDEVSTALDDLPGVGPETRKRLLRRFGSVENVREASPEELTSVDGVGAATAETIRSRLG
ncbi:excinuclease ABC subunit C [Haloarcula sp. JP-L23]|uniref:excinuclease ABC subunit C n=1 Tax=Haloarcula sp. JP-L23 TaxID=2716717 RepID=UPI00140E9717|nr:excinuclease ABC subunit C [Haloarcula sp. JP-L23]